MEKLQINKTSWQGYDMEEFTFAGRTAGLVIPHHPATPKRWFMYAEYFWAFPGVAEALLEQGWYLARLENRNRWGLREDSADRHAFILFLAEHYDLPTRGVLIGMSCGGLHAIKHAALYPEDVAGLYLDAPVINLLSCPMGFGDGIHEDEVIEECLQGLGISKSQMIAYRDHPLDLLPLLGEQKIPVAMLYGDLDDTVPYAENGIYLQQLYESKKIPLLVICKQGFGHQPHGLEDPTPVVSFLEEAVHEF